MGEVAGEGSEVILFQTLLLLQVRDSERPICGVAFVGPLQRVRPAELVAMKALDLAADPRHTAPGARFAPRELLTSK